MEPARLVSGKCMHAAAEDVNVLTRHLIRCSVLVKDIQTGILRLDVNNGRTLPSRCLRNLRQLFYSLLQPRLCATACTSLKRCTAAPEMPVDCATASVELLAAVLRSVAAVDTISVCPIPTAHMLPSCSALLLALHCMRVSLILQAKCWLCMFGPAGLLLCRPCVCT